MCIWILHKWTKFQTKRLTLSEDIVKNVRGGATFLTHPVQPLFVYYVGLQGAPIEENPLETVLHFKNRSTDLSQTSSTTWLVLSLTIFAPVKFGCIVNSSSPSVTVLYTWQHFLHWHSSPIPNVVSPWYPWSASSPCPRHFTFQYVLLQRFLLFP